jgi:hypothetical protein
MLRPYRGSFFGGNLLRGGLAVMTTSALTGTGKFVKNLQMEFSRILEAWLLPAVVNPFPVCHE